ncbi:MAG: DUF2812 domain-containing protein [Anaerocolumna sp.]
MSKLVKKICLDDWHNIGRIESWLSDMARKGLFFQKMNLAFAIFQKGNPKNINYRIDLLYEKQQIDQLNIYVDGEWEFVSANGVFYVFSREEKEGYTELHTDAMEQGFTLEKLHKKMQRGFFIAFLATICYLSVMYYTIFFLNDNRYLSLIEGQFLQEIVYSIMFLYVIYKMYQSDFTVRRLRKQLEQVKPVNHREKWKKAHFIYGSFLTFICIIFILAFSSSIMSNYKRITTTLPEKSDSAFPVIRLGEIEMGGILERYSPYIGKDGIDGANIVSSNWSILSPIQYHIFENGIIRNRFWGSENSEYQPSISTYYYRLTFSWLAKGLIKDLIKQNYNSNDFNQSLTEIDDDNFDMMYVASNVDMYNVQSVQIFAAKGKEVWMINYYGYEKAEKLEDVLKKIILE